MNESPLWKHQVVGIQKAEVFQDFGLLWEQGVGKSRGMIEIMRRRFAKAQRLQRTLILCPVIVCENWKREIQVYSKILPQSVEVLRGTGAKRLAQLTKIVESGQPRIIITNYETMQMQPVLRLLHHWGPEMLICDESQRCKNPDSKRAKAVVTLADISEQNFILTGTPILNSPMDLFMQFRILDRGKTFGKNFFSFRGAYFEDKNARFKGKQSYFPDWQLTSKASFDIHARVNAIAMRVLKKDCLDLPPFVRQVVNAELSPQQAKAYKEMLQEYITFLQSIDGEPVAVKANLAIVKALRLQQIVSGFVKDETGVIHRLDSPRTKVLEELLEDLAPNHKVIVWATFKENYLMIKEVCERLNLKYSQIHGDIPQAHREFEMESFRKDPAIRVMIANQGAAGIGVNLVEASYAIYFSKSFRLEDDLQSEARNYRGGSEVHEKITRIDIITPGTIDELISEALANKQRVSDQILNWNLSTTTKGE